MNGPRWVDNNIILQKQRESQYQKHVQKVTSIVNTQKKSHGLDQNLIKQQQSLYNAKSFNMHFNENQRLNQINKQNQMLLDKLIDISEGKQSVIRHQLSNPPQQDKQTLRAMSQKRKQAAIQIYTENQAMAQRLLNQRSFINKAQIQKEIDEYEKLKAHMQKVKPSSVNKKRNASAQPVHNLPPIVSHNRNMSGYNQVNHKRKLKKVNNSSALNKSAYDMSHDTSYIYKNKATNQSYLNQSEADIIINQYDTNPIQNSNSMPAYQQSHSANIHNPSNRDQPYLSNQISIRGSQHMTPAAILEEEDYQTEMINTNNQTSNFYKNSARASSQISYNRNQTNDDSYQKHQQILQQQSNLNKTYENTQNSNQPINAYHFNQDKENNPNTLLNQNPQSNINVNQNQQSQQQSLNQSQQQSQYQTPYQLESQSQAHQIQNQQQNQSTPNSLAQSIQQTQNVTQKQSQQQSLQASQNQSSYKLNQVQQEYNQQQQQKLLK